MTKANWIVAPGFLRKGRRRARGHRSLEKRLWDAADQFRANSGLKAQEYSGPILGLIFLRFAEVRFAAQRASSKSASASSRPRQPHR
jgi:type I restriction-modification system DNA methylase subunit